MGRDEPFVCGDLGERHPLTCRASSPLGKGCTGCQPGAERSQAFLGKAERQEMF